MQILQIDPLTLLENRRGISKELEYIYNNSLRTGLPYSVVMMDIEFFKVINDNYGHQYDDQILKQLF